MAANPHHSARTILHPAIARANRAGALSFAWSAGTKNTRSAIRKTIAVMASPTKQTLA